MILSPVVSKRKLVSSSTWMNPGVKIQTGMRAIFIRSHKVLLVLRHQHDQTEGPGRNESDLYPVTQTCWAARLKTHYRGHG